MTTGQAMIRMAELKPLRDLRPHERNYREHPDEQIEHIMVSIRENGFYRPIITAKDGTILAGHGVSEAARRLGMDQVPVVEVDLHPNDPRALRLLVGDNEIENLAEDDTDVLTGLLEEIMAAADVGLEGTGYSPDLLEMMLGGGGAGGAGGGNDYTMKVESPVYEITGECPPMEAMIDTKRRDRLLAEIEASGVEGEARDFLVEAANRHVVFNYRNIAEYYAHADPVVQGLMEDSALVIIDFDRAIERGYVRLRENLMEMIEEHGSE